MSGRIPVGLQMYTLRDETAKDFIGTLQKVADMGYKAVEFAGYGGIEAKEMKKVLDQLGLEAPSSHVGIKLLQEEPDRQIEYSLEIGSTYMICPHLDAASFLSDEDQLKRTFELFQQIGERCKSHGLQFGYHNHAFEFEKVGGEYVLDRLYQGVDPDLLVAELDLYWVKKGGLDPNAYLAKYSGRCPLIHVKDMTGDDRQYFAEVGQGIIDYPSIFETAKEAGVKYYIVEQDHCERPPLESVKMSIDYLKSIGIA